ncbi:putative ATP-dependent RNA helicase TDRD12 [Halichoeres trimaculatus]|uniref:putative ATP-dependent RNA helicase TDRD12 n=1 Tax=Halichoeres trimaculatus TaxID=147232 RepID=UPI003D9ED369
MLKISILKIDNPSCLWGRVVHGPGGDAETALQHDCLLAQMNLFYHDVTQDMRKLKPPSLEEGQVYVVYWSVIKSWCRAVVESIISDCQARCFLVDHGERLLVPTDQIRVAAQKFLQLPFWVRRFHLAGIRPMTLRVTVIEKAELIPSSHWDSSATLYLHNLLQASTRTEAVLIESESDSTSIELYLTVGNIKICVNDDLVVKRFAVYIRESADNTRLDEVDQFPVMLSPGVLTQLSPPRTVCSASPERSEQTQTPPVMLQGEDAIGAGDWLTAPSADQRQQELRTCEKAKELQLSPSSQSKNSLEAVAESDSSEETDSSLAAALTKNLSLFRFLKFLNPSSSYQQAAPKVSQQEEQTACEPGETSAVSVACAGDEGCTPGDSYKQSKLSHSSEAVTHQEQTSLSVSDVVIHRQSGAAGVGESLHVEYPADEDTSVSTSAESGAANKSWRSEEDQACSRLLEWLNPEPLNSDPDAGEDVAAPSDPSDPRRSGILVHSAFPVEPCTCLEDAPVTATLRRVLQRKQYISLSPADCYSWPAVARGCNTLVISPNADQPLSYLAPLLTHILLNSIFTSLTSSTGPIVVLLCPGWEKVQAVYDLLDQIKVGQILHPVVVQLGHGKDEAKAVKIPKNCLLLVTTPFSLVRLLTCHCFLFLRMYHLVLDQADQLFSLAPDEMETILQHFQKVNSSEQKASCPQQLITVAKRWTSHMEGLLTNHMPHPCVVITAPEEAALYGSVQQIILMTLESSKISVLLSALDFSPVVRQKTLIITNSAREVDDVFKAVTNKSAFCLKTHEGLSHQFDFVAQQWRKDIGRGTQVILVTTTECLKYLGIQDATCVVHYSFPTSPKVFGSRMFCMAENFRDLSGRVSSLGQSESSLPLTRSVLLISEMNTRHVVGVLRYLVRTNALLPSELFSFAQGVHVAREDQKTNRPLCKYVKSFGACRDSSVCPDRHRIIPQLDCSVLPASGVIEVVPLHIKTASVFYGSIIRREEGGFQSLVSEMTSYYSDKKPGATELLVGDLYAVQEEEVFHRVKILSVPDRGDRLFFSVLVRFIDVGHEAEMKSHQILQLPEQFHSLPGQAVEIIVCGVKPVDGETDWHPKVTRAISQKIRGLQHRAQAVFSLGNTVFVDPMVRVTQVQGMKAVINEYSVKSEILNTGMGVTNPEHLDQLRALFQENEAESCKEAGHMSGSEDGPVSLEARIKAEEEVLAEVSRLSDLPPLQPCEPLSPLTVIQSIIPETQAPNLALCDQIPLRDQQEERNSHTPDLRIEAGGDLNLTTSQAALINAGGPAGDESSSRHVDTTEERNCDVPTKSLHPQVRWFQTPDSVVLTVKLTNPESQRCEFHPDRVVYSGRVSGQTYRADLELHANIEADLCSWRVKCNEPVLTLVKQQQGYWEKLLKSKNIFVSYDLEHFEENKDRISNGVCFFGDTGEDGWYHNPESDSDSD